MTTQIVSCEVAQVAKDAEEIGPFMLVPLSGPLVFTSFPVQFGY